MSTVMADAVPRRHARATRGAVARAHGLIATRPSPSSKALAHVRSRAKPTRAAAGAKRPLAPEPVVAGGARACARRSARRSAAASAGAIERAERRGASRADPAIKAAALTGGDTHAMGRAATIALRRRAVVACPARSTATRAGCRAAPVLGGASAGAEWPIASRAAPARVAAAVCDRVPARRIGRRRHTRTVGGALLRAARLAAVEAAPARLAHTRARGGATTAARAARWAVRLRAARAHPPARACTHAGRCAPPVAGAATIALWLAGDTCVSHITGTRAVDALAMCAAVRRAW